MEPLLATTELQLHLVDLAQIFRMPADAAAVLPQEELAALEHRYPQRGPGTRRRLAEASRLLTRAAVGAAVGRTPQDFRLAADVWGRPRMADPKGFADPAGADVHGVGTQRPLDFNSSHDGGLLALVLSEGTCGIDVEDTPEPALREVADRFCGTADRPLLLGHGAARQLWTAKESAAKALGRGLRAGLRSIHFSDHPGRRWAEVVWGGRPTALRTCTVDLGVRHLSVTASARPSRVWVRAWEPACCDGRWHLRSADVPGTTVDRIATELDSCLPSLRWGNDGRTVVTRHA